MLLVPSGKIKPSTPDAERWVADHSDDHLATLGPDADRDGILDAGSGQ